MMNSPISINLEVPDIKKIIGDLTHEVRFGTMIAQPEMNLGFHFFQQRTKAKMKITKKLSTTEPFYNIVNPFEINKELESKTRELLKLDNEEKLEMDFYKLWEMLVVFDIANNDKLTYSALGESDGNFVQAVNRYREYYHSTKNDKYFTVGLNKEDGKKVKTAENFLGKNKKTLKIKVHKGKNNGDLTNLLTITDFKKEIIKSKKLSNLVTGDGEFNWQDENNQEQEIYALILGEMIAGLSTLDKNGDMIIKIFDCFTSLTIKLLYVISSVFENSYIYKPYFSRQSSSERYFVCKGLKLGQTDSDLKNLINILTEILKQFNDEKYVINIFPKLKLPTNYLNQIRVINLQLVNQQQIIINNMMTYINENNYFGEKYHNYLDQQNKSITYWINNFLVEKSKQKDIIKKWNKIQEDIDKNQEEEVETLSKTLTL